MNIRGVNYAAAVVLGLSLTLAACGGGGAGGATPSAPSKTQQSVNVNVSVVIPTSASSKSGTRRPKYVSPSINSSYLTINQHTGGALVSNTTTDLSAGSPNCTGASPRVCTIPIVVAAGSYDFILKTYDQAPSGGVIPGTAKQLSSSTISAQAISVNQANSITFMLSAIVTGAPGVTCSPTACGTLTYYSLPADGGAHTFAFAVSATDPDGNVITGSVPFTSPISVTLAETGGSGHSYLVFNGTNVGAAASIAKANDTLSLHYDGAGATGYTTTTNIGGSSVVLSPMYVGGSGPAPALSITKLSQTVTSAITEQVAPAGIAYSSAISGSCTQITGDSATGSGASATLTVNTSTAAGTSKSCTVNVSDVDGTLVPVTVNFSVSGPISAGAPVFGGGGGSGTCASLAFTAGSQTATMTMSDPLYTGAALTATSTNTAVATVSESGSGASQTAVVTAVGAGSATINLSDTTGNTLACSVGVTTTSGSVQ